MSWRGNSQASCATHLESCEKWAVGTDCESEGVSHSVVSDSLWPLGLEPTRLLYPLDSPGKNTGVGCHFLPQDIFPTQRSNLGLLCLPHCRQILSRWATGEARLSSEGSNTVSLGSLHILQFTLYFLNSFLPILLFSISYNLHLTSPRPNPNHILFLIQFISHVSFSWVSLRISTSHGKLCIYLFFSSGFSQLRGEISFAKLSALWFMPTWQLVIQLRLSTASIFSSCYQSVYLWDTHPFQFPHSSGLPAACLFHLHPFLFSSDMPCDSEWGSSSITRKVQLFRLISLILWARSCMCDSIWFVH